MKCRNIELCLIHIYEVWVFFVCEVLERKFCAFGLVDGDLFALLVLLSQNDVQCCRRDDADYIAGDQLAVISRSAGLHCLLAR